MNDYSELKMSAEIGEGIPMHYSDDILMLIAENKKLLARDAEHIRQFNELSEFRQRTVEDFDRKVAVLETDNSRLTMFNTAYADTITKLNGMIKFEKEQNETLRKDAERYRGMFNDNYGFDYSDHWVGKSKEEVDAMIDGHD